MAESYVNHDNTVHRPDGVYSETIKQIQQDNVCPFCPEHLAKYHKKPILHESDHWTLTENMYPYEGTRHHLLLIHREHIQDITEMTPEAWADLRNVIELATKVRKIGGGALLMRFGETKYTGASVTHLHAQLISGSGEKDADPIVARVG